jgi:hypothetical protein
MPVSGTRNLRHDRQFTVRQITASPDGDPEHVTDQLPRNRLIKPVVTQGDIGNVLPDEIVYDDSMSDSSPMRSPTSALEPHGRKVGLSDKCPRDQLLSKDF